MIKDLFTSKWLPGLCFIVYLLCRAENELHYSFCMRYTFKRKENTIIALAFAASSVV